MSDESARKTVLAEGAPDDLLDRSEGFRYLDFAPCRERYGIERER